MTCPVSLYCCFGGDFVTSEGKIRYVGGKARVIHVHPSIGYLDLLSKAAVVSGSAPTSLQMKYKYPAFELDRTLVCIDGDEDVSNMMIAFDGAPSCRPPLELYIFPNAENSSPIFARSLQQEANERDKIVTPVRRETSTACLQEPQNDGLPHYSPNLSEQVETALEEQDLPKISHVESPNSSFTLKDGLEFPDLASLKIAVREQAICQHVKLKPLRTDPRRYTVKCSDEGCSWSLRATRVGASSTFRIMSLKKNHTCMPSSDTTHKQATTKWIASFIKAHPKGNANYTIKDIVNDLNARYNIDVSYNKAWRAKKLASKEIQQSHYVSMGTVGAGNKATEHKDLTSGKKCSDKANESGEKASKACEDNENFVACLCLSQDDHNKLNCKSALGNKRVMGPSSYADLPGSSFDLEEDAEFPDLTALMNEFVSIQEEPFFHL